MKIFNMKDLFILRQDMLRLNEPHKNIVVYSSVTTVTVPPLYHNSHTPSPSFNDSTWFQSEHRKKKDSFGL